MKKIINLTLALSLVLFSCERTPEAQFSTDTVEPEVGQTVYFNDESLNAVEFEYDFGDGCISNDPNPTHVFTGTGSFDVVMTVWSNNGQSDQATITINVMIPTLLEVEVLEYYEEYPVADASVYIFPSLVDWETHLSQNAEAEGYTDTDGIVVFSHLGPYVYYVDVSEKNHDNYTLKTEDINFIRTDEITPHKINRFTAWVDYYAEKGKGSASGSREMVILKLERKPDDKSTRTGTSFTDDWQTLYNKSIKLK